MTRPPNTVGCALTTITPGRPNAHLSVRRGTDCAVRPAAAADWKRELVGSLPQPFHCGSVAASDSGGAGVVHRPASGSTTAAVVFDRNAATAARSTAVIAVAIGAIVPPGDSAATMASRLSAASDGRSGARDACWFGPSSWHEAQCSR